MIKHNWWFGVDSQKSRVLLAMDPDSDGTVGERHRLDDGTDRRMASNLKDGWCRQTAGHTDRRAEPWCEGWSLWERRECKCPAGFSASVTAFGCSSMPWGPLVQLWDGAACVCVLERELCAVHASYSLVFVRTVIAANICVWGRESWWSLCVCIAIVYVTLQFVSACVCVFVWKLCSFSLFESEKTSEWWR